MLRGEKTQSALGQLASLPNLHLVASIDHINAPLGGFTRVCNTFKKQHHPTNKILNKIKLHPC